MHARVRDVELGGRRVRHRVAGDGPPVVLVHGLGGSWRWWRTLVPALAKDHCVHLVDIPRLGPALRAHAAADWLADLLDVLEVEEPDVVGHSLGGLLVAQLAAQRPERVRRLALVAPAGIPVGRTFVGHTVPLARALSRTGKSLPIVVSDALRAGPLALLEGGLFAMRTDLRTDLAAVRAPTLIVWGERDHLVPVRLAPAWAEALPHATVIRLPAGHVPMFDAPEELTDALVSFLADGSQ